MSPTALTVSRAASIAYTMSFLVGTVVSLRRGLKAEALGIRTPLSVRGDVVLGVGTALAPPWTLIVALWRANAGAHEPGRRGRRARAQLSLLAALVLSGSVAEPVTHRLMARRLSPTETAIASLNLVIPVILLGASLASLTTVEERVAQEPGAREP